MSDAPDAAPVGDPDPAADPDAGPPVVPAAGPGPGAPRPPDAPDRSRSAAVRRAVQSGARTGAAAARTGAAAARAGASTVGSGVALARDKLAHLDPDEVAATVVDAVHTAASSRWEPARRRASTLFGVTREQKLIAVRKHFQKELVGLSTATGAIAALPGAGTGTALATGLADIGYLTARNADIVLTVAAVHGHTEADVEERTAWVLAVLVFGDEAAAHFTNLANDLARKAASTATSATFKQMNSYMARKVFKGFGAKKGVLTIGKAMPFGVGAVFGGTTSYRALKALIDDSDRFFAHLPRLGTPLLNEWVPPEG